LREGRKGGGGGRATGIGFRVSDQRGGKKGKKKKGGGGREAAFIVPARAHAPMAERGREGKKKRKKVRRSHPLYPERGGGEKVEEGGKGFADYLNRLRPTIFLAPTKPNRQGKKKKRGGGGEKKDKKRGLITNIHSFLCSWKGGGKRKKGEKGGECPTIPSPLPTTP